MSWLVVILVFLLASIKSGKSYKNSVSIIIPAYNEEPTVAKVVNVAKKLAYVNEVIVVDDGSTDNTAIEAKNAGAMVISHKTNQGKGAAIKTGFKNSKGDILAFIDADVSNFTASKIDAIIKPILENKADITKTKFARESGRVTELTAKPLLSFFFPELSYEQPLSGQFAGKRSALNKIKFEKDYGVDVGIVLDAAVHGMKILEVDIGDISHDMSPLADLNKMANEVVRTIIDRAVDYGRVTMMDTLGNYIRMAIMGLSLVILGLFVLFFVPFIPFFVSIFVSIIGIVLTIMYLIKIIKKSVPILRKSDTTSAIKSFTKMHFPVIVSGLILILMLSTFLSAATFSDGKVSVELTSRNFVYAPSDEYQQTISVRGPYTIDSAIENETDIIRVPQDALSTLEMSVNDTVVINNVRYHVNNTRDGEGDTFRLPSDVRHTLDLKVGEVIPNSRIIEYFNGVKVYHKIKHDVNSENDLNYNLKNDSADGDKLNNGELNDSLNFIDFNNSLDYTELGDVIFKISQKSKNATLFNLTLDNKSVVSAIGIFDNTSDYYISYSGDIVCSFNHNDIDNGNYSFTYNGKKGQIEFIDRNSTSIRKFITSKEGPFVSLNLSSFK